MKIPLYVLLGALCLGVNARAEPPNIGTLKLELKKYHDGVYGGELASKIGEAKTWLESRRGATKRPALVLDIDETSLSNWVEIVANDFAFVSTGPCASPPSLPCGNLAWDQSVRATAITQTQDLYSEAMKLGVAVFFVTGRVEEPLERAATELNLWKEGYRGWAKLYMRPKDDSGTVTHYKTAARMEIEGFGFTIIANVGDQDSDLAGGHSERTFRLPNPFYFIP